MRQLVKHASRPVIRSFLTPVDTPRPRLHRLPRDELGPPVCVQCRLRSSIAERPSTQRRRYAINVIATYRSWSSATIRRKEEWPKPSVAGSKPAYLGPPRPDPTRPDTAEPGSSQRIEHQPPNTECSGPLQVPLNGSSVHPAPDEDLPSAREAQRWQISKWFNRAMDDLMPKLAIASQRINSYTGTDYSGIEALRREIREQEQLVKARHAAVEASKQVLEEEHTKASASQKEVVGLLERKHSWSATDLERYMALIRSEHVNDQAVQAAKDSVAAAERALEEARTRLEKRERAQYHEEQIWSDTIRRNSTWVTFGLMGVNILLLLANVVLIEPWRRRRMVREIKAVVEEGSAPPAAAPLALAAADGDIDSVVEPAGVALEQLECIAEGLATAGTGEDAVAEEMPMEKDDAVALASGQSKPWSWDVINPFAYGLFSQQVVSVRRVDITTVAIEAAVAGGAVVGLAIALLRPR